VLEHFGSIVLSQMYWCDRFVQDRQERSDCTARAHDMNRNLASKRPVYTINEVQFLGYGFHRPTPLAKCGIKKRTVRFPVLRKTGHECAIEIQHLVASRFFFWNINDCAYSNKFRTIHHVPQKPYVENVYVL